METNIKKDLSVLTTVSEPTLNKFTNLAIQCIGNAVEDAVINRDSVAELDIGIGKLLIGIDNKSIKYKFKPSEQLEEVVTDTVLNEKNSFEAMCEQTLVNKLEHTYKSFW